MPARSKRRKRVSQSSPPSTPSPADKRRSPRVPILAQVEAQGERRSVMGRASNISVGGLLVETPDTLPTGTSVIVRFFLPPDRHRIEAAGLIRREIHGQSMGISFLGLMESHRQRILTFVAEAEESSVADLLGPVETGPKLRRSGRLLRRLAVVLAWQDKDGRPQQEASETMLLSRHGALVTIVSEVEQGQLVWVTMADTARKALARVVFVTKSQSVGRLAVAFEFLGVDDFWGMDFPPAHPPTPVTRRRSGRLSKQLQVILAWTDEWGRQQQEKTVTCLLSDFGAHIDSSVALPVGTRVHVAFPELEREAAAQVVWARPGDVPGRVDLGVELVGEKGDFWGLPIPPEPGTTP